MRIWCSHFFVDFLELFVIEQLIVRVFSRLLLTSIQFESRLLDSSCLLLSIRSANRPVSLLYILLQSLHSHVVLLESASHSLVFRNLFINLGNILDIFVKISSLLLTNTFILKELNVFTKYLCVKLELH